MNTIMPQHPKRGKISTPNEYSNKNINNQGDQADREKLEKCVLAALRILRANPDRSKCEIEYINHRDASPKLTDAKLLRLVQRALDILHPDKNIEARPVQGVTL